MRTFSTTVRTLLNSGNVSAFYLTSISIPTANVTGVTVANSVVEGSYTVVKETTNSYDLTISGLGTFHSDGGLSIVQGPRQSTAVDRETYTVTYVDPTFEKRALFEAGLTGSRLITRVGFFNTTSGTLSGYAPGQPILEPADILIAYSGVIDTHGYTIDPDGGAVVAVLEAASPMASLGLSRPFYTSREAMKQVNASDTCFNQISINQSKVTYLWGKA
jgi:hypothetical protein